MCLYSLIFLGFFSSIVVESDPIVDFKVKLMFHFKTPKL